MSRGFGFCLILFSLFLSVFIYNPCVTKAYSKTFKDISPQNMNYDIIHTMANEGVIGGYEDGTFRPEEYITRKHAAAIISRAFPKLIRVNEWHEMKDLSTSNSYYNDIKHLYEGDLLEEQKGYIRPNEPLTRGEMANIIAYAYGFYDDSGANNKVFNHPFTDLRLPNHPKRIIINRSVAGLYNHNITTGYEDKTFRPFEPLTRAQFTVFMYRAEQNMKDNQVLLYELEPFQYSSFENVPLPNGYSDKQSLLNEQTKIYGTFSYNNNFDYKTGRNMHLFTNYFFAQEHLPKIAKNFKIDEEELIRIINHVFTTGKVYTSPDDAPIPFAMYYDFTDGFLYFGSDPEPWDNIVDGK